MLYYKEKIMYDEFNLLTDKKSMGDKEQVSAHLDISFLANKRENNEISIRKDLSPTSNKDNLNLLGSAFNSPVFHEHQENPIFSSIRDIPNTNEIILSTRSIAEFKQTQSHLEEKNRNIDAIKQNTNQEEDSSLIKGALGKRVEVVRSFWKGTTLDYPFVFKKVKRMNLGQDVYIQRVKDLSRKIISFSNEDDYFTN